MKYAYFPGCAAKATANEANDATRAIAQHLGFELVEFPNFSCCGAGILHEERPNLGSAINARNFAIAEKAGLDILTICNTCQLTMLKSKQTLDTDSQLRNRVNGTLAEFDLKYTGTVRIRHLLRVLTDDLGLDSLRGKMSEQLKGLKIAPFYGCHMLRPNEIVATESIIRDPLEQLISTTGAEPVAYESKNDCCGFHVMLVSKEMSVARVRMTMSDASRSGADLVVTPCTLCQLTLDSYQHLADPGGDIKMPVIHLPQLVGLALGIDSQTLGLQRHLVPVPEELQLG